MSPRPYNLGKRQAQVDEVRRQILTATRALLAESPDYAALTLDAVAKRADVARATVYYQFGSKTGLLEALCDALAQDGGMGELPSVFADPDPDAALDAFVATFARFWQADRVAMGRLRAIGRLDADVGAVIAARDERRRQGLDVLVRRAGVETAGPVVSVLAMLTSYETFDALVPAGGDLTTAVPAVLDLIRAALIGAGGAVP